MSLEDLVERALTDKAKDVSAVPDVEALVARGMQARRRRRLAIVASMVATIVIGAVAVGPMLGNTAEPAPVSESPSSPTSPTATVGPGRGTGFFGGQPDLVPVTFTMPAGWEMEDSSSVIRSGADPEPGLVFFGDVANIYADGCQWMPVDPPPGPTVDNLVSAYAKVPGAGTAEDVTVDGFKGKQIQHTIPSYHQDECEEDKFALFKDRVSGGDRPNLFLSIEPTLTQDAAKEQIKILILEVDGTRVVILASYPRNISTQDRADLEGILSSIEIG